MFEHVNRHSPSRETFFFSRYNGTFPAFVLIFSTGLAKHVLSRLFLLTVDCCTITLFAEYEQNEKSVACESVTNLLERDHVALHSPAFAVRLQEIPSG